MLRKYLILLTLLFVPLFVFAQKIPAKIDTAHLYENIETYSKRSEFKRFVYKLIFKPTSKKSKNKKVNSNEYKKLVRKSYSAFEGKVIRHITIQTLDPFGYSISDTSVKAQNFLTNSANYLHIKSQRITIRNLLLIRENQLFDSLFVKESERLVRKRGYITDVSFFVKATAKNSDSVDIFIRTLDNWSIIPDGAVSTTSFTTYLTDKNFLGLGHEFQNVYSRNFSLGTNNLNTNYIIPNIKNTYISTTLHFDIDEFGSYKRSMAIDRPFYSPFAKWAAGASIANQFKKDSLKNFNLVYSPISLRYLTQDYWAGYAVQIFKGNTEEIRTTNLITTIRYLRIRYSEKPITFNDPLYIYANEDFYLTGIGISSRRYVQDRYIFKFGVIEDVPIGKVFELTGGYQVRNNIGRQYAGVRFSFGNYYNWGYLSTNIEYGTFLHASQAEQGVCIVGVNYFSGLIEMGKWKFRQFVKPQFAVGIHRLPYDSLTLNNNYGLDGFNSTTLSGTRRMLFTFQTQSYAPWNIIGFRFGPYITYSFGMLGNAENKFKNSKVYSQIAIGILIKNDNLIFGAFQLSISFFPIIPGHGSNIFKTNTFKTTDFGFRDFEIGKPKAIVFQ